MLRNPRPDQIGMGGRMPPKYAIDEQCEPDVIETIMAHEKNA
jgi:hypothetical protein